MDSLNRTLGDLLTGLKTVSTTALGTALSQNGYVKLPSGASAAYNSFGPGPAKNSISIGHNGRTADLYVIGAGADVDPAALPRPEDLILVVQATGAAIMQGRDILSDAARSILERSHQVIYTDENAEIRVKPFFHVRVPPARGGIAALDLVFGTGSPAGRGPRTQFRGEEASVFLRSVAHDIKKWEAVGVVLSDRDLSGVVVEEYASAVSSSKGAASSLDGSPSDSNVAVLCAGTGELVLALYEKGYRELDAWEAHPVLAGAAAMRVGIECREGAVRIHTGDAMAPIRAILGRTYAPMKGIVAAFPFVSKLDYAEGAPAGMIAPCICDAFSYPAPPMSADDPTKELKASDSVGAAMLNMAIGALAPGGVGTFVVPSKFGVGPAYRTVRTTIVSATDVVSYIAVGAACVLTVRRREVPVPIPGAHESQHMRPAESSNAWVRWYNGSPVLVTDSTLPGRRAGEVGAAEGMVLGDLLREIVKFTPKAIVDQALLSASATPADGYIRLSGDERYVRHNILGLQIAGSPDIIVHRTHIHGTITFGKGGSHPLALGVSEMALTSNGQTDAVEACLRSAVTVGWIANVSTSPYLTPELLAAIPMRG
jgi:hypothetical protein